MHSILRICTRCGYDLTGQTTRCPECGCAVDEITIKPDSRAVRWLTNRWRWVVAPSVFYLLGVIAWHALIHPATWHGYTTFAENAISVALIFGIPFGLHAMASRLLRRGGGLHDIRSRIWFLTLPALHVWWLVWPLVVILALMITLALGVDFRTQGLAIFILPLGIAPVMPLVTWRIGWWMANKYLQVKVRPGVDAWAAAVLIGVPSGFTFVMMVSALATIDV